MARKKRSEGKKETFPSFYDNEKIAEMARNGFNRFWEAFKNSLNINEDRRKSPDFKEKMETVKHHNEFLYYTAFEDALNTFLCVSLDDAMHSIELCVDELGKVTAELKEDGNKKIKIMESV